MAPAPRLRFGSPGELVISSDANLGLTGQVYGGVNGSQSTTGWNLTVRPSADYFVVQGLSIGAFVDFTHTEKNVPASTNGGNANPGTTADNKNAFGVGPRIGYNIPIVDWISWWPSAGLSFSANSETGGISGTAWTLVLYAPFLYHLASHFFVGLGPYLSTDLAANYSQSQYGATPASSGPASKMTTWGLQFTVGGWFSP
jgi:hypothetical protein